MQLPLRVTFRILEPSAVLQARIRELAGRLDRFSPHIMNCQVTVEAPHRHSRQGWIVRTRTRTS